MTTCRFPVRPDAAAAPPATISLTVGTAGHIDHGKTQLIRFLTGCATDRLPEEQARGMTIDLGFATCVLPDNRRVGIVDVPGHERFIHNMVAGATGIDVVMLVVAADDGVMPQTIEHFHIVRLLGVRAGLVALTKIDLVAPARVEEVADQVRTLVAGSFLDGCPVAPVSSKTGQGFDGFYTAFVETVDRTAQRDAGGVFRLHVERAFVLQGIGTVVSGIPRSGSVRLGDELELLPSDERFRVRGIQVYGAATDVGTAGECVALRLGGMTREKVTRGAVLAPPGFFAPARFVNAHFYHLPEAARPLRPRSAVRLHVGTAEATGYLVLPTAEPLLPGAESYVQFQLNTPIVAAPGDFFVARALSPVRTVGGGTVVAADEMRMRRSRGTFVADARAQEEAGRSVDVAVRRVLCRPDAGVMRPGEIAHGALHPLEEVRPALERLAAAGAVAALGNDRYAAAQLIADAAAQLMAAVGRLHDRTPLSLGFAKKDLFRELPLAPGVAEHALADLAAAGRLARGAAGYYDPAREARLNPHQAALADGIAALYRRREFASPRRDELPGEVGAPPRIVDPILDFLVQRGDIVAVSDKVLLHREVVERSRRLLEEYFARHAELGAGAFKDLLGTSRKYAIPLLEYWDGAGLTRRVGDNRVLRNA